MMAGTIAVNQGSALGTLTSVTRHVLERYANVFTEPADDEVALSSGECLFGHTCFHGGMQGSLSVAAPVGLCKAMAATIYRDEVAASDLSECTSGVLGEITNIIAGHLAMSMDPREHVWLSPPVVEPSSFDDWIVMGSANGTVRLNVEGWPLLASLNIIGP